MMVNREIISDAIEHARLLYGGTRDLEGALTFLRSALCSGEAELTAGDLAWASETIEGLMDAAAGPCWLGFGDRRECPNMCTGRICGYVKS